MSESLPLPCFMENLNYISRVIKIGNLPLGGKFPIRIQSMTTTNTLDTEATVAQAIRMIEAGCELVRITAQGVREAENLYFIKQELIKRGYRVPLIADIHYNPKAAEVAAKYVEKVRINPGNYSDRKHGKPDYSESEYKLELEKIREKIRPLIEICKRFGTVLRIGSNHGSLSERILLKYGDTPAGMVESALEFVRICREFEFNEIVLSMKASNVKIMVQANRLLVLNMLKEDMNYPIHLGVTEAGGGEDGRLKSAAGIGPLLEDGIGDTIRVSLTEDPEFEIPVAKSLVSKINRVDIRTMNARQSDMIFDPISYQRRITMPVQNIGNGQIPVVILSIDNKGCPSSDSKMEATPDYLFNKKSGQFQKNNHREKNQVNDITDIKFTFIENDTDLHNFKSDQHLETVFILKSDMNTPLTAIDSRIKRIHQKGFNQPIIFQRDYDDLPEEEIFIQAASDFSYFLVDGLLDGIWITHKSLDYTILNRLSFGLLQATGERITKTEYIACPSCGRTLYKIQDTLQKIKNRTSHLKGLKIGVMGCCVNGPGEMADADYGYVGAGKGKITLYKGKQIIQAGIPEEEAVEALVSLIRRNGDWK
jgi:(E)-4-hydroxy-3-methylbut-2-enyl-diphosphate synthase